MIDDARGLSGFAAQDLGGLDARAAAGASASFALATPDTGALAAFEWATDGVSGAAEA